MNSSNLVNLVWSSYKILLLLRAIPLHFIYQFFVELHDAVSEAFLLDVLNRALQKLSH